MGLKTLLNCSILTVDSDNTYYSDGALVISDNVIAELGNKTEIEPKGDIIDMSGKLIMPGLVNTHTHSASPLFRGAADDLRLMDWLKNVIWPAEKNLTAKRCYWGAALTCLEFIKNGITCFADQYFFALSVAEAVKNSGLRGFIAPSVFSHASPESDDTLGRAVEFIEMYKGQSGLIYPCIGPHAPYSCTAETLSKSAALSAKYNVLTHIHISETLEENEQIIRETGLTPTEYLDKLGVLDNPTLAAHCVHINDNDIEIFRKKNVRVSYNPVSNLKLVSGIMPLKKLLDAGVLVSLGTDGVQSNNSLDMLRDLKTGVLVQKQITGDPTFFKATEAIRMITINGAKALGIDDKIGSLEAGKLADIISIDLTAAHIAPVHKYKKPNLESAVVYTMCGSDVRDVIVNGKFLMKDRQVEANESEIIFKAHEASKEILGI